MTRLLGPVSTTLDPPSECNINPTIHRNGTTSPLRELFPFRIFFHSNSNIHTETMSKYSGKPVVIERPAEELFNRISNLESFQERLDAIPAESRAQLGDLRFTADSIVITAPAVGEMTFNVTERVSPSRMVLQAANSPVPFAININLKPLSENSTEVATVLDVEIPAMLRPMIGGKMQEAADKFSEMFSTLFAS